MEGTGDWVKHGWLKKQKMASASLEEVMQRSTQKYTTQRRHNIVLGVLEFEQIQVADHLAKKNLQASIKKTKQQISQQSI